MLSLCALGDGLKLARKLTETPRLQITSLPLIFTLRPTVSRMKRRVGVIFLTALIPSIVT